MMFAIGVPLDRIKPDQAHDSGYQYLVIGRAEPYAGYITNYPFYLGRTGGSFLSFHSREGIDFCGNNPHATGQQPNKHQPRVEMFRWASLVRFIPIAERDGLTANMGQWAMTEAVAGYPWLRQ